MKYQNLFSGKNKKNIKLLSAEIAQRLVKVKRDLLKSIMCRFRLACKSGSAQFSRSYINDTLNIAIDNHCLLFNLGPHCSHMLEVTCLLGFAHVIIEETGDGVKPFFLNGFFLLWIWTCLLLQKGCQSKIKIQNDKKYRY